MSHPGYGRDGKRLRHVHEMTADELHRELVADAVAHHAAAGGKQLLARQVAAYQRIGQLRRPNDPGLGAEEAINAVLDEVATLTGQRALPVT